jgi:hypothetical protein
MLAVPEASAEAAPTKLNTPETVEPETGEDHETVGLPAAVAEPVLEHKVTNGIVSAITSKKKCLKILIVIELSSPAST